jgi:hypothetical protein
MRCQVQIANHSKCPDKTVCKADPSAVIPGHRLTVVSDQCPNEAMIGGDYCSVCNEQFAVILTEYAAKKSAEAQAAAEAEQRAIQEAADALAALNETLEGDVPPEEPQQ